MIRRIGLGSAGLVSIVASFCLASPANAVTFSESKIIAALMAEHFVAYEQEIFVEPDGPSIIFAVQNRKNPKSMDVFRMLIGPDGECSMPDRDAPGESCEIGSTFLEIDYRDDPRHKLAIERLRLVEPDVITMRFSYMYTANYIFHRKSASQDDVLEAEYLARKDDSSKAITASIRAYRERQSQESSESEAESAQVSTSSRSGSDYAYCYSMADGDRSFVSAVFPRPDDWGPARQVNAFRAYTSSRYNDHNVNVTCSSENSRGAAQMRRDEWIATLRRRSDVIMTDWKYGAGD